MLLLQLFFFHRKWAFFVGFGYFGANFFSGCLTFKKFMNQDKAIGGRLG